jgi:hypothetical protein
LWQVKLDFTPFPQQQFNQTEDRRSEQPSRGVTCFDCHANGHTNKATHLAPDARPTETRHPITTPTLRGVFIQRLFGSQRALKTVEDFTEFEQRGAYFDGDDVIAAKKNHSCRMGADCRELQALGLRGNRSPLPRKERPVCGARNRQGKPCAVKVEPGMETELLVQADRLVGGSDAVLVIDDTAIPKKGTHSVGSLRNMRQRWARPRTARPWYR